MADTDRVDDNYVTMAVVNGECTPTLVEEMQQFITDLVDAINEDDSESMDRMAEQWNGDD